MQAKSPLNTITRAVLNIHYVFAFLFALVPNSVTDYSHLAE